MMSQAHKLASSQRVDEPLLGTVMDSQFVGVEDPSPHIHNLADLIIFPARLLANGIKSGCLYSPN